MTKDKLKFLLGLFLGPLGGYLLYQYIFILSYIQKPEYLSLKNHYMNGSFIWEALIIICLLLFFYLQKKRTLDFSTKKNEGMTWRTLFFLTIVNIAILLFLISHVLGEISLGVLLSRFDEYYMQNTSGVAMFTLMMFSILYAILLDMYLTGVKNENFFFLLLNIILLSANGGRGIVILLSLTCLILLIYQNMSSVRLFIMSVLLLFVTGSSYLLVTDLREQASIANTQNKNVKNKKSDYSFRDLNYNAAFVLNDVLSKMDAGELKANLYFMLDLKYLFLPRRFFLEKPSSTGETLKVYPEIAKRGTNITFPLKANLLMHLGKWAFLLDWIIVFVAQIFMYRSIRMRCENDQCKKLGFIFLLCGTMFPLVSRGGIFNVRLVVLCICIFISIGIHLFCINTEKVIIKVLKNRIS